VRKIQVVVYPDGLYHAMNNQMQGLFDTPGGKFWMSSAVLTWMIMP
jgi:hypothetical protein